ncbi:MAG: hypothetical protein Fur0041_11020 [Bacteroidia bacterium]
MIRNIALTALFLTGISVQNTAYAGDPPLAVNLAALSDTTETHTTSDTSQLTLPVVLTVVDSSETDPPAGKPAPQPSELEKLEDHNGDAGEDWDTTVVHAEKFDVLEFNDTVKLVLNDPVHCNYVHPFNGNTTSSFGFRKYRYHFGVDINLETGDSVRNCFDGKVRIAQYSKSYGYLVVVRHDNGLETYYAHLSKLLVKPGETVEAGALIGLGGNTGHSFGSHLHFEIRYKGQPINPNYLIDFENRCLRTDVYNLTKSDFKYLTETHKIVRRSRKSKKVRVTYYTPGGPHYATAEAKAIMAKVPDPVMPGTNAEHVPAPAKTEAPKTTVQPQKTSTTTSKPVPQKTSTAGKGAPAYHTVKKGDTLSAIAVKYGTTVTKICQLNGIKSTTTLQIGRKLRVK